MIDTASHGHEIRPGSERSFGVVFATVFAVLGGFAVAGSRPVGWLWFGLAIFFGVAAFVVPQWLAPLNRLWFRFGMLLARIVQPLVVGAIFFLVVTPIGVVMRLTGKDLLSLRPDPSASSYWIKREPPGPAPETMSRQF